MTEAELIFAQGEFDQMSGAEIDDNPFSKQRSAEHFELWRSGWKQAYLEENGVDFLELPTALAWYSIEDVLPEPNQRALIRTNDGQFEIVYMNNDGFWVLNNDFIGFQDGSPTFTYWSNLENNI